MSLTYSCRISLSSAAEGAQHSLDDACCSALMGLVCLVVVKQSLETSKCKIHFEVGYFTPSFLVSFSVAHDFGETSVSAVEGPDNTGPALALHGWEGQAVSARSSHCYGCAANVQSRWEMC